MKTVRDPLSLVTHGVWERAPAPPSDRVHLNPLLNQEAHRLDAPLRRSEVKRRPTVIICRIQVDAVFSHSTQ